MTYEIGNACQVPRTGDSNPNNYRFTDAGLPRRPVSLV